MAYLKPCDTVVIDTINFEKFMDYRTKKNLTGTWAWMNLPLGTLMEVSELIFRTTASRKSVKKLDESAGEYKKRSKGRSCWVKCKIIMPIDLTGNEYTIPLWILKKSIISHVKKEVKA